MSGKKSKHWIASETNEGTVYFLSQHVHPDIYAKVYPNGTNGKYIFTYGKRAKPDDDDAPPRYTFIKHDGWKNPALAKMAAMSYIEAMEQADTALKRAILKSDETVREEKA